MRTLEASFRLESELDPVSRVVLEFEEAWRSGPPPLDRFRARFGADESTFGLAELVKADLQNRYRLGEKPTAREYLDRFPELAGEDGRALSLIYEEYCLRAETDEPVDPSAFCDGYPTWRDSLASQLAYHQVLGRAVEPLPAGPEFPEPGTRFGEYVLDRVLGSGGVAKVYLALSTNLGGKRFAIKISPNRGGEPAILGKLDHPNIVPVLRMEVDAESGLRGLTMPYRPGLPLDAVIRRLRHSTPPRRAEALRSLIEPDRTESYGEGTPAGWSDFPASGSYADAVAWLGRKMAGALAHAHEEGFFHRDVKPENILLTARDGPQLIDFNLAHAPDLAAQAVIAHRGGTLPYMAPEHLEAFRDPIHWPEVAASADIYSLALVLRELLTLCAPARPPAGMPLQRAINTMLASRAARPVPIRRLRRGVPHALEAILSKCLALDVKDRYPSAAALEADLKLFLERRPLRIASNPSRIETSTNHFWRHRRAAAIVALAVALPMFARAVILDGRRPSEATLREVRQALEEEKTGRIEDALATIRKAARNPDAVAAIQQVLWHNQGSVTLGLGLGEAALETAPADLDLAQRSFLKVNRARPADSWALNGLARIAILKKDHAGAIRFLTEIIDQTKDASPRIRATMRTHWMTRARELNEMGDAALEVQRFVDADSYFARSLADLDCLDSDAVRESIKGETEALTLFSRYFYASLASFGRGSAAQGGGHGAEAMAFFDSARVLVPEAERWAKAIKKEGNRRACLEGVARLREKIPGATLGAHDETARR
jgi:serine/threonine protein kinase